MKELFFDIVSTCVADIADAEMLWQELEQCYAQKHRHYHTFRHLENMCRLALENRDRIAEWEAFLFAIFYHDAVYQVLKSDNEEKSAALAEKRLLQLGFPGDRIAVCKTWILATKHHRPSADATCNLFLDIDLAILGSEWEIYEEYARQIRREYAVYPDLLYNPGRKKVLGQFLERTFIFLTPEFQQRFEAQARENVRREIAMLG